MANKRKSGSSRSSVAPKTSSSAGISKRPRPKLWQISARLQRLGSTVSASAADDCDSRDPAETRTESAETKGRSTGQEDGGGGGGGGVVPGDFASGNDASSEEDEEDEDEELGDEEVSEEDEDAEGDAAAKTTPKSGKHIRPCVCDLTKQQRQRIDAHLRHRSEMQRKHERRVKEIEEELARMEEERLEREREMQEQEELFGDEYELVGKKRKRKKRSARRASMVSLGVKQVINWRKEPRIEVKATTASRLRQENTAYCGHVVYPLPPITQIDYRHQPQLQIRLTVASAARAKVNAAKKEYLIKHEDKRKLFETPYYV